jgi:hypothetical protein
MGRSQHSITLPTAKKHNVNKALNIDYIFDQANNLETYLTIITKDLLQGSTSVMIILELHNDDLRREDEITHKFSNHPQFTDKTRGTGNTWYQHLLCKTYQITTTELENFSEFLLSKIHQDFADITLRVIEFLYPEKNISKWRENFLVP